MKKRLFVLGVVAALAALPATTSFAASRGTTFTPLGTFPLCGTVPEGEFCEDFPITTVTDMTGDGSRIVGLHAFFTGAYEWTAENGLRTMGPVDGAPYISRDGSLVGSDSFEDTYTYGYASTWNGVFWDIDTQPAPDTIWTKLPVADGFAFCDFSGQSTFGVSSNWVVGLTWIDENGDGNGCEGARAFAWSAATGTVVLDDSVSGDGSYRANAVNDDGSVITGWSAPGRTASVWLDNQEQHICQDPAWFCNEGWDVTPDGATVLFTGASPNDFNTRASLYDVASGDIEQLPFPDAPYDPAWDTFQGWAVSDDGGTVVGEFGGGGFFGSPPYPVMWNRDLGMTLDVQVFLLGQGLDDLFFWFLEDDTAVNSDGTIIAGSGVNPDGWIEAWSADISRVKVCHKPEGDSNGARRTLTIGWDGLADHLGHGDYLSTCEFALADGHSRAMDLRKEMVGSSDDPNRDARMGTMQSARAAQARAADSGLANVRVANPYPTDVEADDVFEGGQGSQKRQLLERRIERYRGR
jgi:hypothetical protein